MILPQCTQQLLLVCCWWFMSSSAVTTAWSPSSLSVLRSCARQRKRTLLQASSGSGADNKETQRASATTATTTTTSTPTQRQQAEWVDEDAGAGVVGAQFFGGNKQKEEFFDPIAEAKASQLAFEAAPSASFFDRFAHRTAFDTAEAAQLAANYQELINLALAGSVMDSPSTDTILQSNVQWESPWSSSNKASSSSPLVALQDATKFFRRIHVAITSAQTLSSTTTTTNDDDDDDDKNNNHKYKLRWEISVAWPTFWEPSVLLTGTSICDVVDGCIQKQVDTLDDADLLGSLARQILPRFWDVYHIGMTPSAELSPAWERRRGLVQNFCLYDVPARWAWAPIVVDVGSREDANASFLPNHSFTTAIRTMGPNKDIFVPTSPTQIDISPSAAEGNLVTWKIPVSVELQAQTEWPLFQSDDKDENEQKVDGGTDEASGSYVWQPARRVATLPTGLACPQDEGVTELRKRLYERVTAAGLKPKLDANGRPCFFFWSATTKSCFTDKGLGMAVYEWRPAFAQSNHIGMELEETPELLPK